MSTSFNYGLEYYASHVDVVVFFLCFFFFFFFFLGGGGGGGGEDGGWELASGIKILEFISTGYSPVRVMLFRVLAICLRASSDSYFKSSVYIPSFPQLLLFFSFATVFATFLYWKESPFQ